MSVTHQIADDICIITLDNPPVNVIGAAVRTGLLAAIEAAEAAGVSKVIVTGAGGVFAAGADAKEFGSAPVPPHLPEVLARLAKLPAIAAISGAALGGGLEIALACRVRIAHPGATLGLPEVTLGVIPGAGGTQRLPRVVGLANALGLIPEGRVIGAAEARRIGLVDQIAEDPLQAALALEVGALAATIGADDRPAPAADEAAIEAARATARKRMAGQTAPAIAIDLVAASTRLPLAEGLQQERAAFLGLRSSDQAAALRHVFFAERAAMSRGKDFGPKPSPMTTAVVVGGGNMGASIAYALGTIGLSVTLVETDAAGVERARANVSRLFDDAVSRGKSDAESAARQLAERFRFVQGYDDLPAADIAIEAAFEDLGVKKAIFAALDKALPETTVLATNTSYLDVNAIFEGIRAPGRVLGMHFFSPAHVMKLLEVVRAAQTSQDTLARAFALASRLKKIPVEAGVCDGFIGNRILTRYRQTTDILLIEGALPAQIDAALEGFGMAMGPYAVQDLSGLDIAYANRQRKNLRAQPGIRYIPIADRMVEDAKRLGRKTNAGWYDYDGRSRKASALVDDLVRQVSAEKGIVRRDFDASQIVDRAILSMIEEGLQILDEGIAKRPADIDLVMVHGYAFPRWRGGPMHLADRMGLPEVRARIAALAAEDPLSWRVPPILDRLIAEGRPLSALN